MAVDEGVEGGEVGRTAEKRKGGHEAFGSVGLAEAAEQRDDGIERRKVRTDTMGDKNWEELEGEDSDAGGNEAYELEVASCGVGRLGGA